MKRSKASTERMKTYKVPSNLGALAADALTALLGRVSAIKLLELKCDVSPQTRSATILARTIFARIEVFGHSHTLACAVIPNGEPSHLRSVLREAQTSAALHESQRGVASSAVITTPVLIAPRLSPEAQSLCKQNNIGFLDLDGNARLNVGDVFIVMRSLHCRAASQRSPAHHGSAALHALPARSASAPAIPSVLPVTSALPHFSRKHVGVAAVPA
jgi:hypothetical protein